MRRNVVALAVLVLILAAIGCGGGSSGSVTYAPTVVPIKHIDFTGVELTMTDVSNPPARFVNRYPAVVATVNGRPVSNKSLAYSEIANEFNRRQREAQNILHLPTPPGTIAADPLQNVIDNELTQQLISRLKLLPSREEGVVAAKTGEASFDDYLAKASHDARATAIAGNRLSGYPDSNWASDPKIVEAYRQAAAQQMLSQQHCPPSTIGLDYTPPTTRTPYVSPCADFLAKERKNAKIVYYVRWADS